MMKNKKNVMLPNGNGKNISYFSYSPDCRKMINDIEYELIIKAVLLIFADGNSFLRSTAKKYSKDFPILLGITNKKYSDKEKIIQIFTKVMKGNKADKLCAEILSQFIIVLNKNIGCTFEVKKVTAEILSSCGEEYIEALTVLLGDLDAENITWILKIIGFAPNEEQQTVIDSFIAKHAEAKKTHELFQKMINEAISPIEHENTEIKETIKNLSDDAAKLGSTIKSIQLDMESTKNRLKSALSELKNSAEAAEKNSSNIRTIQSKVEGLSTELKKLQTKIKDSCSKYEGVCSELSTSVTDISDSVRKTLASFDELNNMIVSVKNDYSDADNNLLLAIDELRKQLQEINTDSKMPCNASDTAIMIENALIINESPQESSFDEFADCLDDNFSQCGITCNANYVSSVLFSGFFPLFVGYSARETAVAVSITISGETPTIVSLADENISLAHLEHIIESKISRVILIEDAVGTMRENKLFSLFRKMRTMKEKPLLFLLSESNEDLQFVPQSFFSHVTLIQCCDPDAVIKFDNLESCSLDKAFSAKKEMSDYKEYVRKVRKILNETDLTDMYIKRKSSIFRYYHNGTSSFGYLFQHLFSNEIKYISSDADRIEHKLNRS